MTSARLLALVLLLSSFTFAQNQAGFPYSGPPTQRADALSWVHSSHFATTWPQSPLDSQGTLLTPQMAVVPFQESVTAPGNFPARADAIKQLENGERHYLALHPSDPHSQQFTIHVSPQGNVTGERSEFCYSMRSYLMARDSKDSDSTHLVSTSTCQPAQRYTVKTTDPQTPMLQR